MKTFLNVLYRRILYKIPFKWLLVFLVVVGVLLFSFSDAKTVSNKDTGMDDLFGFNRQYINGYWDISPATPGTITCAFLNTASNGGTFNDGTNSYPLQGYASYCTDSSTVSITTNFNVETFVITVGEDMKDQFFPQYTSLQCQTAYSLIPISSVNQSYCVSNGFCPAQYTEAQCKSVYNLIDESECTGGGGSDPSDCPNVGVSNVFINDIFHPGAYNIVMNISEEIDWDYAYTNSGNNLNIDVVGYNVDYEKIGEIIDHQSYKPTGEDFQKIIGVLAPYTKIIVFFVFLFIVWAWIKKPFKSKKL